MRKLVTLAAAWLLAATVAVAVAWLGVGIVTSQVTDDRPSALASDEVRELASDQTSSTTSSTSPGGPTTVAGTPSASGPPATAPSPATSTPAPSTTVRNAPPVTTTSTTTPIRTTPTTAPTASPETRTYNVTGGSVALRFAPEGVSVLWATPNEGFDVDIEPEQTNGVRVEFESDAHRSRVDGWWSAGPQDRVREEPR